MTKHNVFESDCKLSDRGFEFAVGAPSVSPSIHKKKAKNVNDYDQGVNAWVESMRASSPTRIQSPVSPLIEERDTWIRQHPSALERFDEITKVIKGKQVVIFLDYDGTLSPIVDEPDQAFMSDEMRMTVKTLAKFFRTAIVSGRCRDKVYNFVKLPELYYAGSHGMDIRVPLHKNGSEDLVCQPASEFLPMIDEVYKELVLRTKSTPGSNVENNKFCLSVHFRCVEEKEWNNLATTVLSVLKEYPKLYLIQGRKVLEIRPLIKWDKGKAIEFLLESFGYANRKDVFSIYIGDDKTDEDAFKALKETKKGLGILVSKLPKITDAAYSLEEPKEVMAFLQRVEEWKLYR